MYLKEVEDGKYGNNIDAILKKINEEEKQCAINMLESDKEGSIGEGSFLTNGWTEKLQTYIGMEFVLSNYLQMIKYPFEST